MTDENSSKSNKPTFIAYTVKNRPGEKDGIFTRIGAAFANADGKCHAATFHSITSPSSRHAAINIAIGQFTARCDAWKRHGETNAGSRSIGWTCGRPD